MTQVIVYRKGGKEFGRLWPDGRFTKVVRLSKHLFRKTDSWGIDAKLLNDILVPKEARIEIYEEEQGKTYCITAADARRAGTSFHFQQMGEDHRMQVFIPRTAFTIKEKDNETSGGKTTDS